MAIGPQIVQPLPAAIITRGVGTKVPRGVYDTGASVRWRHGIRPLRRRWSVFSGLLLTQRTVGLVRQAGKWFGLAGAFALGLRCHGRGGQTWLGPHDMQHGEEPYENEQGKLVEKKS